MALKMICYCKGGLDVFIFLIDMHVPAHTLKGYCAAKSLWNGWKYLKKSRK